MSCIFLHQRDSSFSRLYDKRIPLEPAYPSILPSKGEVYADDPTLNLSETETELVRHAPPG